MKTLNAVLLSATLLFGAVASTSAEARGGGHHRHLHHGRIGVFIGAPLVFAPWYYSHRYYYPSTVVVPAEPTVYIEKSQSAAQPSQAYWYYCPDSNTYYPYVSQCAVPWQREVPRPPPS
jgi:hypothetical protein